jgi:nicotinamide mononucleotide transporter
METLIRQGTRRTTGYFRDWSSFERTWLLLFTALNIGLFFAWDDSLIGLIASLTGMLCVILTAKGKISNYYFGIINCIAYAYVAYSQRYYGEVLLNILYYLPMSFVGIYCWKQHVNKKKTNDDVIVRWFTWKQQLMWLAITILGTLGVGLFLRYIQSDLPFIGAFTVILSIIAMILTVQRASEQWILWIIVDVVTVYMWFVAFAADGGDVSMLVMWTAFLTNAIYGLYNWNKLAKEATA